MSNITVRNWAHTQSCRPAGWHEPASETEVQQLLAEAARKNLPVKVIGAGHSWSPIAMTDGLLLRLVKLNQPVSIDPASGRVTVQAGIRLKELNALLPQHGLALRNLGSIAEQSIAGAIATGTHGTGIGFASIPTQVVGIRMILADGSVLEADETHNADLLPALRVHLGALGIVTQVTLQTVPAFRLREVAGQVPFDSLPDRLPELLARHSRMKIWWLPHTRYAMLYGSDPTDEPATLVNGFKKWLDDRVLPHLAFAPLLKLSATWPGITPPINRLVRKAYFQPVTRVGQSDHIMNIAPPPRHDEMEYAFDVAHAAEVMREIPRIIDRNGLLVNFISEFRFVKGDDSWMSPCYGRDSCYVGAYQYGNKGWQQYQDAVEDLMTPLHGRPHWGKNCGLQAADFAARYPRYADFAALRQRLDPHGRFLNPFLRRVFGL